MSLRRPSIRRALTATLAACMIGVTGCSSQAGGTTSIDYWLWDANQLPSYAKCIAKFEDKNPDINVRINQLGWSDYWTKLTASFVADSAPDVFTNHLGRYPELVKLGVLQPLDELPELKSIKDTDYEPGLAKLWTGSDGHRYGVPKDYDTVSIMYDKTKLQAAGITDAELASATWNPTDGGSFEKILAKLTVDKNGKRGDQKGFDKTNVKQYGLGVDKNFDYTGQTNWSPFALSTGWYYTNKPTWGTEFNYDNQQFQNSLGWYVGLSKKGYMPRYGQFGQSVTTDQQLASGQVALSLNGSWMLRTYANLKTVKLGISPLPSGPVGHPVSLYNGLGDSISKFSKHKTEAAKLVAFLGSDDCQNIVGTDAVVFPARPAGTAKAIETYRQKGLDVTPFTDRVKKGQTALYPLVYHGSEISSLMQPTLDSVWIGSTPVSALTGVNTKVNAILAEK
ncbi:ABC transporter substrate-binding protein [Acidipropionibacterium jensenii]|uniref:ABC transporter substrate-binding protein n=1 Tax=Acidipropionibacterium jensenii TaxID=1749 RepID=UPI00264A05B4|nr:sugar ABC transporter substrate-binding protein [Acidipropionibacterium jensenii]MDN5977354.1 sugar ABC transporter substrate-binding protein [Acidipropionibacterium jensenii]MDN5995267.1 sugar ABC transporter substrate-binding protein [Acidipropionibacterium jensenii]MDN6426279.1 sugar ABC transporter substrate-binding protein [Acidipropionibacterium jensenii]MDN6440643.1 sugar ABC transporter substrate-binding protein [Acidipropionibacterium jensenii]MDN6480189.1 sugar ABC transporter sub